MSENRNCEKEYKLNYSKQQVILWLMTKEKFNVNM